LLQDVAANGVEGISRHAPDEARFQTIWQQLMTGSGATYVAEPLGDFFVPALRLLDGMRRNEDLRKLVVRVVEMPRRACSSPHREVYLRALRVLLEEAPAVSTALGRG
jgi:hypothetical protein